ncbi:hypothetical protein PISMIDRAFT_672112 [Pisolithus microcarpus 441]|uniref:Uncharacterized protein n=1 Tax=Pisolithus microcarpus 441 TaxID=765257 RepID=A0A0C9YWG2_9AGAM|nr:hypothetical protein PISMIDRAFT_672112 [Pisolithus microcarpus 441]
MPWDVRAVTVAAVEDRWRDWAANAKHMEIHAKPGMFWVADDEYHRHVFCVARPSMQATSGHFFRYSEKIQKQ